MLLSCWALLPYRHSFPTRRSSDLTVVRRTADAAGSGVTVGAGAPAGAPATRRRLRPLVSSEPGGISCEESGSGVWVLSAMRPSPSEGPSAPWLHVVIVPEDGSL